MAVPREEWDMNNRLAAVALLAMACLGAPASGQTPIRIGVLEDMSGSLADITGPGSVLAAKMAVEDFGGTVLGRPIEVLSGDHQNKADVGGAIARQWYDSTDVGMITGLGNSAVALAVRGISRERGKIDIVASGAISDLTGKACSRTGFHWTYDSYSLAKTTAGAVVKAGGDSWFFITADYAYGHAAQRESTRFIEGAGGTVVGSVSAPPSSTDFSSFLLQAQSSKAKVVGFASAGTDFSNAVKQAGEFGLVAQGQTMAGLVVFITDVNALGLNAAKGLYLTEAFYWDLDEKTRAWSSRFFTVRKAMPTMAQAGVYSAVTHYLKSVATAGTVEPAMVTAKMLATPVNDFFTHDVKIREDGRVMRDMYLFQVKSEAESKAPWDYYRLVATVPGETAFRPLAESECPYITK
jgi:branched-chain amino acid transport system substrate-binding protein